MKRRSRIFAGLMAAILILGCHEDKDSTSSQAPASSDGGDANPAAQAPSGDGVAATSSAALRELVAPPSSSGGYVPASGDADPGRALFDGTSRGRSATLPLDAAAPTAGRRISAQRASARRPQLIAASARRSALRGAPEPPLPHDPSLLRTASVSAGAKARGAGKVLLGFAADQIAQGYATIAPILSRAGWGAAARRGSPIPMQPMRVTIHHTDGRQTMTAADTSAEVRAIQAFHMGPERGWNDIGYHFLIDGAGRVIEGRPAETLGAHARSENEDNIGIAMMGDFDKIQPTPAQVESLTRLVSYLAVKYKRDPAAADFVQPHRHYDRTACPGRNMMVIFASLRRQIDGETDRILARLNAAPGRFQPVAVVGA